MTENPVPSILSTLRTEQATSPALIWYGPNHERIELSGKVLDNWVAKTSNFLVEELDAEPGTTVQLELPVHWKTLVWALSAWQTGCSIALSAVDGAQVRVTSEEPASRSAGEVVVAAALPALAMSWPGQLPAGTVDYAAEVRAYADTYAGEEYRDSPAVAVAAGAEPGTAFTDLLARYAPEGAGSGHQVLLAPAEAGMSGVLAAALGVWASGGTLVLLGEGVQSTERLMAAERVTARLGA